MRATRISRSCLRNSGGVAKRGASAADDAVDRLLQQRRPCCSDQQCGWLPSGSERSRPDRRPERRDRIPLGRKPDRAGCLSWRPTRSSGPVAVIVGNTVAMLHVKATGTTIPIVFATGSDPVRDGLVASLNRPGGNITGVAFITGDLGSKRLELLRADSCHKATKIAVLVNPKHA